MISKTPSESALESSTGDEPQMISAVNWLGYGINFLAKDAPDGWALDKIQQGSYFVSHRPVKMSNETKTIKVGKHATDFRYPVNLRVADDQREVDGRLRTWASGTDLVRSFNLDTTLEGEYLGLAVEAGAGITKDSQYTTDHQYALISKTITSYSATFESVSQEQFIDPELLQDAVALPDWNYDDTAVREKYKLFFHTYGTHVINFASYGWRYQLEASQSNLDAEEKSSFYLNMDVKFNGYNAGADYKQSEKYKKFDRESRASVKAIGGALNLATAVMEDPANLDAKASWEKEAGTLADEGLTNLKMVPIAKIFDGLSPAPKYRPVFLKLAESLFDLEKGCSRTLKVYMNQGSLSLAGSITLESKDASFVPTHGEIDDKFRNFVVFGSTWPYFGGEFPIKCGRAETVEATVSIKMSNKSDQLIYGGSLTGSLWWDPKDDGKPIEMERFEMLPGRNFNPHDEFSTTLKATFHTKPGSGGEYWWLDGQN